MGHWIFKAICSQDSVHGLHGSWAPSSSYAKKINGAHGLCVCVAFNSENRRRGEPWKTQTPWEASAPFAQCYEMSPKLRTLQNIHVDTKKHAFLKWFERFVFTMSFLSLKSPMIEIYKNFMGGNLWGLSIWVVMILLVVQKSRTTTWVVSQTL